MLQSTLSAASGVSAVHAVRLASSCQLSCILQQVQAPVFLYHLLLVYVLNIAVQSISANEDQIHVDMHQALSLGFPPELS